MERATLVRRGLRSEGRAAAEQAPEVLPVMQTGKAGGGVSHEVSGAAGAVDATVASVASGRAVPEAVAPAASGVDRKRGAEHIAEVQMFWSQP
jgi:hypothetical protein